MDAVVRSADSAVTNATVHATSESQSCHICGESHGPIFEVYAYTFVCRRCKADEKLVSALVRWNKSLDREWQ
jgi:hypothetical protein